MNLGKALAEAGKGHLMTRKAWKGDGYFGYFNRMLVVKSYKNPEKKIPVSFLWDVPNLNADDYVKFEEGKL